VSTQLLAENLKTSTTSIPDVGEIEKVPDEGGALTTTTTDADVGTGFDRSVQVSVNVRVAPKRSELGGSTRLRGTGVVGDDDDGEIT